MKHEKMLKKALAKIETPEIQNVLSGTAKEVKRTKVRSPRKLGVMITAIVLCCCMVVGVAAAVPAVIPIILEKLNAPQVKENTKQLTEVPEGYIGIYTKEELVQLSREFSDERKNYILMSDIEFSDADYTEGGICEGGFTPIGSLTRQANATHGGTYVVSSYNVATFNGNGYVIRNLKLGADNLDRVGLFYDADTVINLGIEDCEINVDFTDSDMHDNYYGYWGAIVGHARLVGSCYVDGLRVNIRLNVKDMGVREWVLDGTSGTKIQSNPLQFNVGGLCGRSAYVDSCYVNDAVISVAGEGNEYAELNVGGIAGAAYSCVTSYFCGNINTDGAAGFKNVSDNAINVTTLADYVPIILNEAAWNELSNKVEQINGENEFRFKMFKAYYMKRSLDDATNDKHLEFVTEVLRSINDLNGGVIDLESNRVWYIFDPTASHYEFSRIANVLLDAFEGDKAALIEFCSQHNAKCGQMYCYTVTEGQALNSEVLYGFDFDTIWTFRDGKPIQQIFAH